MAIASSTSPSSDPKPVAKLNRGQIQTIEVEPLTIPISGPIGENPWQLIYGALRNDPEFIAWAEAFWVGKKRNKDNDEILSVEECMQCSMILWRLRSTTRLIRSAKCDF
jgi:hypothetical protein